MCLYGCEYADMTQKVWLFLDTFSINQIYKISLWAAGWEQMWLSIISERKNCDANTFYDKTSDVCGNGY